MTKYYCTLLFLLLALSSYAQNEELTDEEYEAQIAERKEDIKYKEFFRLYYVRPNGVGNNVIAKANEAGGGVGMGVTFGIIGRVHIIGGAELTQFKVTDKSLAGNASVTNMQQLYVLGMYKFSLNETFEVNPGIAVGNLWIHQRRSSQSLGKQNGFCVTPTVTVDLKLDNIRFFVGLNYCLAFPKTHTNAEYKDFFGRLQMLNLTAGFKL
ncbi:hypothetical protein GWA97_12710 [Flavobacterium sp. LaA7.5]|nr:hypothetical protein [Flavobacterium salilacus subsp. altitudinum]